MGINTSWSVVGSFDFGDSEKQLIASLSVGEAASQDSLLDDARTSSHDLAVDEASDSS